MKWVVLAGIVLFIGHQLRADRRRRRDWKENALDEYERRL